MTGPYVNAGPIDLKPCPFCGAPARATVPDSKTRAPAIISCSRCSATVGQWLREADGAAAWNTRAPDPQQASQHKDLEEALELFVRPSMSSSSPHRGESSIGWQRSDGPTAGERLKIAREVLSRCRSESNG